MSGVNCCKDCKDRKIGCHATCDIYKKACEDWEKIKAEHRRESDVNQYVKTLVDKRSTARFRRKRNPRFKK